MEWSKELPQAEGDYLWICMWSCGCCVRQSGICWVYPDSEKDDDKCYVYETKDGRKLRISWEGGIVPIVQNALDVDFWMPIKLPKMDIE